MDRILNEFLSDLDDERAPTFVSVVAHEANLIPKLLNANIENFFILAFNNVGEAQTL